MQISYERIKKIYQKNDYVFTIEWLDGKVQDYQLSNLQKNCLCARCVDEHTGKRLSDPSLISNELTAKRIYNVGRYALKVEFSSGCSRGIFPYRWLKSNSFV